MCIDRKTRGQADSEAAGSIPHSPSGLGAWLGEPVHGRLLGDDPRAVAGVPGVGDWRKHRCTRTDRGGRRGRGLDHQGVFGRSQRPLGASQAVGGGRLWAGCFVKAAVSARHLGRLGLHRAVCGPHRQGHPRCTAGCAAWRTVHRRRSAARPTGCGNPSIRQAL